MTIELFIILATIGAACAALLTQAIKKAYENAGKKYSANAIAAINAAENGVGGTAAAYSLLDIPFGTKNVICIVLMAVVIWIGAMIGYDKVIQLLQQIKAVKKV